MNVIADGGLVGIVTETGAHWATVRSIIDDSSNVSATVTSISQNCMVTGDLQMMDDGKIRFIQLTDKEDQVQEGDKIVTSSVSNKFLKGILIGYISEVSTDANKLTKSGTIIPAVDFNDIQEVLVIKELKQQKTEDVTSRNHRHQMTAQLRHRIRRRMHRRMNNEKKADSGGIDSAGICLTGNRVPDTVHRFHRPQSAFDPHSIVWIYERKKEGMFVGFSAVS